MRCPAALLLVSLSGASAFLAPTTPGATRPAVLSTARPFLPRTAKFSMAVAEPAPTPEVTAPAEAIVAEEPTDNVMETLKTGSCFALWYLFNIANQIYNKKALNALGMPYSIALLQLFVGIPYVMFLWGTGLRKAPKMSVENVKTLFPVSLFHLGTHVGAVVSLSAGAVSFTHIVKASEPVVSAAMSAVFLGAVSSPITYATLLPIVLGVCVASVKELSFTWLGFIAAMLSNLSSASRAIFSKKTMKGSDVGENMTPANLYAVITILSFLAMLPASLCIESPAAIAAAVTGAMAKGHTAAYLASCSILSGFFFYLYNEVAFLALNRVNPLTHAVANTVKRVVIIVASVIAFKTPISAAGVIGSSIAIAGTLLYTLAKSKFG